MCCRSTGCRHTYLLVTYGLANTHLKALNNMCQRHLTLSLIHNTVRSIDPFLTLTRFSARYFTMSDILYRRLSLLILHCLLIHFSINLHCLTCHLHKSPEMCPVLQHERGYTMLLRKTELLTNTKTRILMRTSKGSAPWGSIPPWPA
jgi:hypothetical protein